MKEVVVVCDNRMHESGLSFVDMSAFDLNDPEDKRKFDLITTAMNSPQKEAFHDGGFLNCKSVIHDGMPVDVRIMDLVEIFSD